MDDLRLTLTGEPDATELARLGGHLASFNDSDVGPSERQPLAVFIHATETLVAGLSGYTAWGWLYVQWLWVAETHRRQGLSRRLLGEAEEEARRRSCHGAYIDTFNPRALRAYQQA